MVTHLNCKNLVFDLDSPNEENLYSHEVTVWIHIPVFCTPVNTSSSKIVSFFSSPPSATKNVIPWTSVNPCTVLSWFWLMICQHSIVCSCVVCQDQRNWSFSKWCTRSHLASWVCVCVHEFFYWSNLGAKVNHCHPAEPCLHAWALQCAWWTSQCSFSHLRL